MVPVKGAVAQYARVRAAQSLERDSEKHKTQSVADESE